MIATDHWALDNACSTVAEAIEGHPVVRGAASRIRAHNIAKHYRGPTTAQIHWQRAARVQNFLAVILSDRSHLMRRSAMKIFAFLSLASG